jgi:hypothetical protein
VQVLQNDAPAADAAPAADVAAAPAEPAAEGAPAGQAGDLSANAADSAAAGLESIGFKIQNSQPCKYKLADGKYTHHHAHICMPGLVWAWWGAGSCLTWLVTGVPGSCAPKLADDLQLSPLASACLIIFVTLPAFGMFCFLGDWV